METTIRARGRSAAFTLIELLTVIAIIAVLVGILLPVFARARGKAMQATCLSHNKQLAHAAMLYVQDWDNRLPSMWDNVQGNQQSGGWVWYSDFPNGNDGTFQPARGSLYTYTRNTQIFVCPDDDCDQGCSYAINALVGTSVGTLGFHAGLRLTRVTDPVATLLFVEEASNSAGSTDDGYLMPPGNQPSSRHFGGSAFSFCDGHVKWLPVSDVSYPNPRGSYRYEPRPEHDH